MDFPKMVYKVGPGQSIQDEECQKIVKNRKHHRIALAKGWADLEPPELPPMKPKSKPRPRTRRR